jgi:dolichol-phosphate mannosyltransferase
MSGPFPEKTGTPKYDLTIIVPVYCEEKTLDKLLNKLAGLPIAKQIVVVNDGSTDGSGSILDQIAASLPSIEIIHLHWNRGKGHAVRAALPAVRGKYVVVQDADLEYDPEDIVRMLERAQKLGNSAIFGSRYLDRRNADRSSFRQGVRLLTWAARWIYGLRLTDLMTCYKMIPAEALHRMELRCERFEFCAEVAAKASRMHLEIIELPIRYTRRMR